MTTTAKRIRQAILGKPPLIGDNPRDIVRRLVKQHVHVSRQIAAFKNASLTEITLSSGETATRDIAPSVAATMREAIGKLTKDDAAIQAQMLRALRGIPVYDEFLKHTPGVGEVTAAMLVAYVDIHKAVKPSQLIRYCGYACIDGKAERRSAGCGPKSANGTGTYNDVLKSQLFQMTTGLRKHAARWPSFQSKYLVIWEQAKRTALAKAGVVADDDVAAKGVRGFADAKGRRKATEIFLQDLYIMWRTLEGLPVWPPFLSARRGFLHGGVKPAIDAPRVLTLDDARELVGLSRGMAA